MIHEETLEHPIFIQLKTNAPELDKDPLIRKWMYDPSQIQGQIDTEKYWFVDKGVGPQGLLGFGARIWNTKVGVASHSMGLGALDSKPATGGAVGGVVADASAGADVSAAAGAKDPARTNVSGTQATSQATEEGSGGPTPKKPRILAEEPSVSDTPEEQVTANRIKATKEAFAKGMYVLDDKLLPYSAEYQLRDHKSFLLEKSDLAHNKGVPVMDLLEPHMPLQWNNPERLLEYISTR